jgi:two-component system, OmpR family, alkaline phosphatase synthesis response regulator PhoP
MVNKRILLVDDSPIILTAARHALTEAGYEVTTRDSFDELMGLRLSEYDLILMDVQMPELYCDDVAAVLRNERGVITPIYLFSSINKDDLASRAAAARVDGYISKEVGIEGMVERVREILAQG